MAFARCGSSASTAPGLFKVKWDNGIAQHDAMGSVCFLTTSSSCGLPVLLSATATGWQFLHPGDYVVIEVISSSEVKVHICRYAGPTGNTVEGFSAARIHLGILCPVWPYCRVYSINHTCRCNVSSIGIWLLDTQWLTSNVWF